VKAPSLVAVLCLLALAVGAPASPAEEPFKPSQRLSSLLAASRAGGQPLLSAEERDYFDGLPARAKELFEQAIANELLSEASHLGEILSLGLPSAKLELFMRDNCVVCHTDASSQEPETLLSIDPKASGSPRHLNLKEFVSDVHFRRGLSCAGCHGGDPNELDMADEIYDRWPEAAERRQDRTWIPGFCASCHADPASMRRFNPGLATDQYAKYEESRHGERLLRQGDSKAAQCVSCHGVHGIRGPRSPRSSVHPQNIPYTCAGCHADPEYMAGYLGTNGKPLPTDQLQEFEDSVHGRALLDRGDLGAPACNDCHGNHAAMPPEISSIAQVCRACHANNGELFDGSKHKVAFERNGWPECETCHGNHAITETNDSMLSEQSDPLCYECHREQAPDNKNCVRTARYFHSSIKTLAGETASLDRLVHALAEKGLDVDALSATVEELDDLLRQSRSMIHAFDWGEFEEVNARGREAVEKGEHLIAEGRGEYSFRRNGALVAVGIMALLVVLIHLKLREMEARR
jgi:predicted CXXCH cytochrome family protein